MKRKVLLLEGNEQNRYRAKFLTLAENPLLGVSSFAMVGDKAKALEVGFGGYTEKPINPFRFAEEVSRFLRK